MPQRVTNTSTQLFKNKINKKEERRKKNKWKEQEQDEKAKEVGNASISHHPAQHSAAYYNTELQHKTTAQYLIVDELENADADEVERVLVVCERNMLHRQT